MLKFGFAKEDITPAYVSSNDGVATVSDSDVSRVCAWVNNYPRQMFGYTTSQALFEEQLSSLA